MSDRIFIDNQFDQNKCIYITKQYNLATYDVLHNSNGA